ncbi:hypothetical protein KRE40_16525 [Elizabethkingia meningoseptica]|uniref:bacteriocin-like protein n=1 Tax=Elizabethkingia meningoseptica TaxID=238 RepID=UPI000999AFA3|nr:hypothetical protein [Elizabethkingia meningoseptica]EJK5330774.1 hypothetical protein [Elizabethkingia meningoseptica]MDE5432413.1 hypothetical protein [Elizabethkingia meningoseptica]MDE5439573.1 hypothetical protein [Elizabethkingia meningoseptica]MDE5493472.1 hypothetical protein [Elizabethkingia meningoseptica]MDE5510242.1 hypothetical protein [Elizabethkingia meningoseptica]
MKNLKKLTRTSLKEIHGGTVSSIGNGSGPCYAHWVPGDQMPEPGAPYDCGCNRLIWCPGLSACVHSNLASPSRCETGL